MTVRRHPPIPVLWTDFGYNDGAQTYESKTNRRGSQWAATRVEQDTRERQKEREFEKRLEREIAEDFGGDDDH
jgi:hypothetical protein